MSRFPVSYVMESPEKVNWQNATQEEYEAIIRKNTFEVTDAKLLQKLLAPNGYSDESVSLMAASDIRNIRAWQAKYFPIHDLQSGAA